MLVAAAAASGIMTVTFELARSAWIAQRVPVEELASRNAQMSMGTSLSETVAFAIGGWIYQAMGAALALIVDAASYVISALLVRNVPPAPAARNEARDSSALRSMIDDVREGLRTIAAAPILRMLATVEVLVALGMSTAGTSYMIFVARDIGFDTGTLGMIFATGGIGSLIGAWLAPRLGARAGVRSAMLLGLALLAIGAFCIPLAPGATILGAILLIAHQVVGDGGYNVYDVHDRTLRQAAVAPHLLARVDSGIRTLGQLARLLGAVGGGFIATEIGTRSALALSAAIYVLAFIVVARFGRMPALSGRYSGS
jgi:predicted MFS family arabinose efflux permease